MSDDFAGERLGDTGFLSALCRWLVRASSRGVWVSIGKGIPGSSVLHGLQMALMEDGHHGGRVGGQWSRVRFETRKRVQLLGVCCEIHSAGDEFIDIVGDCDLLHLIEGIIDEIVIKVRHSRVMNLQLR